MHCRVLTLSMLDKLTLLSQPKSTLHSPLQALQIDVSVEWLLQTNLHDTTTHSWGQGLSPGFPVFLTPQNVGFLIFQFDLGSSRATGLLIRQRLCKKSHVLSAALSKCFVVVGSIAGVIGSKCQVPLTARGLPVESRVE